MIKPLLTIQAPRTGISASPHTGFGDVRQLDIFTVPGAAQLNNLTAKKSATTVVGRVNWFVKNPATPAEVYALDADGKVYKSTDSGASWALMTGFTAGGHGNGLAIWKNYLIVARDAFLDVCGDGTATGITNANWTNSWKAIDSDLLWHPMLVSKNDNKLYGGAGRYVFSLDENAAPFVPATAGSYTWTPQALDLPPNYRIKCAEELGNNLMLGTWQGVNVYDLRIGDIFPWDRSSSSFGQPITLNEFGIHAMLNTGNSLTVLAGIGGQVFVCDGVTANPIANIPQSIADLAGGKYLEYYPGAIMEHKKKIYFGVSSGGSATTIAGMGVYSLSRTAQGSVLVNEHLISTGSDGSATNLKIGALLPLTRDNLLIGWKDDSTYGIDNLTVTSYATSYTGYFESPLYQVGTNLEKKQLVEGQLYLGKVLATNEGVKVKYRLALNQSWTTVGTFDFATVGAITSHDFNVNIPDATLCQIRVELTGTTTTPQFRSLTLA